MKGQNRQIKIPALEQNDEPEFHTAAGHSYQKPGALIGGSEANSIPSSMCQIRRLREVMQKIWQSLNLEEILATIVVEARELLSVERFAIYRLGVSSTQFTVHQLEKVPLLQLEGQFVAEAIAAHCTSLMHVSLDELGFDQFTRNPEHNNFLAVEDIYQANLSLFEVELLTRLQIRAYLHVPIVVNDQCWGILCAHYTTDPYAWQATEIDVMQLLASQLAIAIQQSQLYQQVQQLNVELERQVQDRTAQLQQVLQLEDLLKRITDKVRDSLDENQILGTAVQELALGLGIDCCDAALYDLDAQTATVRFEHTTSIPSALHSVWQMTMLPEVYAQLLQGECFQFCLDPHPIRGQVTILACPIFDDQEIVGDLWLFNGLHSAFTESEVRLVRQVANQCAIAIRQARLYQASQSQVQELEKLNRLKDDFLSTVSHELRTPVSNMKMAIHMLKAASTEERRARYLNILQTECERETELISDLLDLQRLEAASYPVFMVEAVNLQKWLPQILEPFYSQVEERQQHLNVTLPEEVPHLVSDRASLERILAELLHNACKYTPTRGNIALGVQYCASALVTQAEPSPVTTFTISNEVEIPETELPRIFDKFYRVPHADPWKQGGTGLGLALVQRLVDRLKGTIRVESRDGWTIFTVRLPQPKGLPSQST